MHHLLLLLLLLLLCHASKLHFLLVLTKKCPPYKDI